MSHVRSLGIFLFFVAFSLVMGGCGNPWRVVSQASPNPMRPASKFSVQKLTFQDLQVGEKSDKQYADEKESKTAEAWEGDKTEMAQAFAHGFTDAQEPLQAGDGGDFVVQVNCAFIEPGYYAYVASAPAEVHIRAKILDRAGKLVDEIDINTGSADRKSVV